MGEMTLPIFQKGNEFFTFSRRTKSLQKYLRFTFAFSTLTESIPPEKLQEHRKLVEPVWEASVLHLRLARGYAKLRKRADFGALPPAAKTSSSVRQIAIQKPAPAIVPASYASPAETKEKPDLAPAKKTREPAEKAISVIPSLFDTTGREFATASEHRATTTRERKRGANKKCRRSLLMFLGAIVAVTIGAFMVRTPGLRFLGGLLGMSAALIAGWALVLAVLGLIECAKHPRRYNGGKTYAILTLLVGTLMGVPFMTGIISGMRDAIAAKPRNPSERFEPELLKFPHLNFAFKQPTSDWKQADPRMFGRGPVLAFAHGPINFTLCSSPLEPGFPDARARLVHVCKETIKRDAITYQQLSEQEVTRNGLGGWQIEGETNLCGHEFYIVHWIVATNGFGYQLAIFGPMKMAAQVKQEADALFSNFGIADQRD
jgi:hypothetical protein